jgi:hypothetical protein
MDGRFRYWRHVRTGEVVAVVLNEDGQVIACSDSLDLREAARQYRTDVLPNADRCLRINEHRFDYRAIPPTQIDMLRYRYGSRL